MTPAARAAWLALLLSLPLLGAPARAEKVGARLEAAIRRSPDDVVPVLIRFAERVDLSQFRQGDGRLRRQTLRQALRERARESQAAATELLLAEGVTGARQLWMINGMAARVPARLVEALAARPEVEIVTLDAELALPDAPSGAAAAAVPGWNLEAVGAPELWGLGFEGQGITVATLDTGVDPDHPALAGKAHPTNGWFDPWGEHASPVDLDGHGTQATGLVLAGTSTDPLGVAPGAQWIGVKIFNDAGVSSLSAIHEGFQWLLDLGPSAPDVVVNPWAMTNTVGLCDLEFAPDVAALRTAGIPVVFAAGNSGPSPATSTSPANNPGSVAVGAVDDAFEVYAQSGRGPSACDLDTFPELVAPGVDVLTTDRSFGGLLTDPVNVTGTSFSAPHVAGALALLMSAFPNQALPALEEALVSTALDLGEPGPDDVYGAGLIDLPAAYDWLSAPPAEDRVEIVRALYRRARGRLLVWASSDAAPEVVLSLPAYGVDLGYDEDTGLYGGVAKGVGEKPPSVTVVSSGGGSDTRPVPFPDRVRILAARYHAGTGRLRVVAISNAAPEVTLSLPQFGAVMEYRPRWGHYRVILDGIAEKPTSVTVVSSGTGAATARVHGRHGCGLGFELTMLAPLLLRLSRRARGGRRGRRLG